MIEILLATYNSSHYWDDTINSILRQDETNWRLIIQDGGSTDGTQERIKECARSYPEHIIYLPSERSLSARDNFSRLLDQSCSDYVMFCDHDDIWFTDKISKTYHAMQQAEQDYSLETPVLVFTDQHVANDKCEILSHSNLKHQKLPPQRVAFNQLLLQNVPSGCTTMMNRALVNRSRPIPPQAVMHDHWVSLVAAAFGKIIFLNEPTMMYRQHDKNIYGAPKYGWSHFYSRYKQGIGTARARLNAYVHQAIVFYERYAQSLQPEHRKMLADLAKWNELSWVGRREVLFKHKILKTGFRRNLGMFLIV